MKRLRGYPWFVKPASMLGALKLPSGDAASTLSCPHSSIVDRQPIPAAAPEGFFAEDRCDLGFEVVAVGDFAGAGSVDGDFFV